MKCRRPEAGKNTFGYPFQNIQKIVGMMREDGITARTRFSGALASRVASRGTGTGSLTVF